jgi:hypothetical protein
MGFKRSRVQIPPARFVNSVAFSYTIEASKDIYSLSRCSVDFSVYDVAGY